MTEAKLAPNLPGWMVEHANRYLSSGGTEGHMYKMTQPGRPEITVPALLLTTTGRKSGERFIFPRHIEGETVTIRGEQLEELLAGFDLWRRGHRELLMRRVG